MGFCFYVGEILTCGRPVENGHLSHTFPQNNAAVAAAYLKTVYREKGIKKILILDW